MQLNLYEIYFNVFSNFIIIHDLLFKLRNLITYMLLENYNTISKFSIIQRIILVIYLEKEPQLQQY